MPQLYVKETALVDAPPAQVYAAFADYVNHHPNVLPKPYFTSLDVLEGGYGAGTKVHVEMKVFGVKDRFDLIVSEPVPGEVLVEVNPANGLKTTFTVKPGVNPSQSQVSIETVWQSKPGLGGLIERLTTPPIMHMLYKKELRKVEDYLKGQAKTA